MKTEDGQYRERICTHTRTHKCTKCTYPIHIHTCTYLLTKEMGDLISGLGSEDGSCFRYIHTAYTRHAAIYRSETEVCTAVRAVRQPSQRCPFIYIPSYLHTDSDIHTYK